MFKIGDEICSEKETFVIQNMGFEVHPEDACWWAFIELKEWSRGEVSRLPVWMVLEMLKDMMLFYPGDEEKAAKYRAIIAQKKADGMVRYGEAMKRFWS